MTKYFSSLITIVLIFWANTVHALDYKVTFSAAVGNGLLYGIPAPQSSVNGAIYFSTAQPMGEIMAIQAIDLTISGHAYQLSEIGFRNEVTGSEIGYTFGGLSFDVDGQLLSTDDFYFYVSGNGGSTYLAYTTLGKNDYWESKTDTTTAHIQLLSAVPEPSTYIMLLGGLALLAVAMRHGPLKKQKPGGQH